MWLIIRGISNMTVQGNNHEPSIWVVKLHAFLRWIFPSQQGGVLIEMPQLLSISVKPEFMSEFVGVSGKGEYWPGLRVFINRKTVFRLVGRDAIVY